MVTGTCSTPWGVCSSRTSLLFAYACAQLVHRFAHRGARSGQQCVGVLKQSRARSSCTSTHPAMTNYSKEGVRVSPSAPGKP
eukprot:1146964-Pelagomonas_calceolata.AAC.3